MYKSIENSNCMPPLASLLHASPTLTYCNLIQTSSSSSSSKLQLSDDCVCKSSHNIKIRWEGKDNNFLLPHLIISPSHLQKQNPLSDGTISSTTAAIWPQILKVEVRGKEWSYSSSHVRGNYLEVSLQQAKHESQSQLDAQCHL